jgi:hypothetical protein
MRSAAKWLPARRIDTRRLILDPLQVLHADEMVAVSGLAAHINPRHGASIAVAQRLGLTATGTIIDGETRWTLQRS